MTHCRVRRRRPGAGCTSIDRNMRTECHAHATAGRSRDKVLLLPARDNDGVLWMMETDRHRLGSHPSVTTTDDSGDLDPTLPSAFSRGGLPQGFHLDWNQRWNQRWNLGFSETAGSGTHVVHVPWLNFVGIANGNDPQVFVCGDNWDGTAELDFSLLMGEAVTASSIAIRMQRRD